MNDYGQAYRERWALPGHDGLTAANLEGAVRLGWLTRAEVDDLLENE